MDRYVIALIIGQPTQGQLEGPFSLWEKDRMRGDKDKEIFFI